MHPVHDGTRTDRQVSMRRREACGRADGAVGRPLHNRELLGYAKTLFSSAKPLGEIKQRDRQIGEEDVRIAEKVPSPQEALGKFLQHPKKSWSTTDLLTDFGEVEAFRIEPQVDATATEVAIGPYKVLSGPQKVESKVAKEIVATLRDPTAYNLWPGAIPFCGFVPGVAVRFTEKNPADPKAKRMVLLICFDCNEMAIAYHDAGHANHVSIRPGRGRFVRLVKQVFPKDEVVQELTEKDEDAPDE